MDRGAWQATVHGVSRVGHDLVTKSPPTCKQTYRLLQTPVASFEKKKRINFAGSSAVKNPPANAGDRSFVPGLGRSPGEGNGNPLQYT